MKGQDRTKAQLIDELVELRGQVAALEAKAGNNEEGRVLPVSGAAQKEAEREQNRLQAILTTAVECLPFDFFALGPDGRCILQNALARQHFGDGIGKTAQEMPVDEHIRSVWLDNQQRAFAGEQVASEVTLTVRGEKRHCHNVVAPIRTAGEIHGILGVTMDITDRVRAEEAVRESEERYRTLADASPDIIYVLDRTGKLLYANRTAAAYIGVRPASLVGKTQDDLFPPDQAQHHRERIRRVFETGESQEMEDLYRFGSQDAWLNVRTIPVRDEQGRVTSAMGVCRNITAQRRAEEALQRAHDELEHKVKERTAELAIFQRCAEAWVSGLGMADLDGHIVYANPRLCRLFGEEKPEDVIGQNVFTYYPEEDRQKLDEDILPAVLREGSWKGERVVLSRSGTWIPTLEDAFLVRDENGKPSRVAVVITDVSEQKKVAAALRASEERFELAVEGAGVGIWDWDILTGKVYYSPRWKRLFGYEEDEIGDGFEDWARLLHPDERESMMKSIEDFLRGTSSSVTAAEYCLRHKDGSYRWIEAHAVVVRNEEGKACRVVGSNGDITARKWAEEALRRSEESLKQSERRFRNYFEQGLIGMAVTSLDGHWLEVNERLCQILGYGREELLQKTWTQLTYPEDIAKDLAEFNRLLAGELDHYQLDKRFIRKDGNLVYTTIQVRAFQKEDGSIDHIVGLMEDITARKRAEEALERERQSLWRMLQASDHERRLISYEIHDGLAQYLAAAGMQFQSYDALRDNSPDEATKAYQTAVELVRQAHFEARHLVSEVRPPVIDEIGLETAVSHLVHEQRRHGGPNIELHSNVQFKRLASILENAIYRIVQEALSNACKHSQSKKVTVSLTQEGQEAWLRVQDWGVGFDPESVGNGHFGLEGIRQRVRLLGGRLTIESAPSSGTMVQVVVPILEKPIEGDLAAPR